MMLTLGISPLFCSTAAFFRLTLSTTNLPDSAVTNSEQFRTIHSHIPHRPQQHPDRRYETLSNFGTLTQNSLLTYLLTYSMEQSPS